jgi:chaperonin GroES
MQQVRPLHDRVFITRAEDDTPKFGSIIIPDTAKEKPHQGTVKGVGTGKLSEKGERVPPEVKVGDRILFGKYSGSEVTVDGELYLIMREDEILAVID